MKSHMRTRRCTGEMPQGPRAVAHARQGFRRLVDTHGSKGCWAHRKDGRSSSPAGRLPACAQHRYSAQIEDIEKAYRWLFEQGIRPQKHRQHRSLHWRKPCCEPSGYPSCEGCCSAGAILSVSPWYDLEANNQTMDNNAETDELFTKALLGLFQDFMRAFHEPDRSIG